MQITSLSATDVHVELTKYRTLRERLLIEFPEIDPETLADTLEGITDLRDLLAEIVRSALDDEALSTGLTTRLADMKARVERFEERARKKRQLALRAMAESDIQKLTVADFTASLKQSPTSLDVLAEDQIPAAYWKPQPSKLDKQRPPRSPQVRHRDRRCGTCGAAAAAQREDEVMTFTDTQTKALQAKLSHRHVKTREQNGANLCYVEGWHAIAEANRIFGFDSWDRQTIMPTCIWQAVQRGQTVCFYSTKVRITVRAGGTVTTREGIGTGLGRSPNPEQAHEMALKVSETDATKRALATFGNPFGLALYDRDRHQVTKPRSQGKDTSKLGPPLEPLSLVLSDGRERRFDSGNECVTAALDVVETLPSVDAVYAFWTANLPALTELKGRTEPDDDPVERIIAAMKLRLRAVSQRAAPEAKADLQKPIGDNAPALSPASLMARPKEKRLRDKEHLVFVAGQPCLICGRKPAQAHHWRFAQPRAMAMKVSDEFTVPLCNLHHDELHRTGDERAWWARHGIVEPLKFAARLWAASRLRAPADELDESAASPGESGDARGVPSSESGDGRQIETGSAP